MARKSVEQIVEKYGRGVAGAGADYLAGVQAPSRPWAQATVAGAKRWRTALTEAMNKNRFEAGVQKAGDAKWQQNAANVGAARYTGAASIAQAGYAAVAAKIMQAANAAQAAVASMPDETLEQRIARSAAAQRAISKSHGKS